MLHEVRAAHAWAAREGDLPLTASITASLGAYWFLEGHHAEGLRWIDEMLAVEDRLDPVVAARIHLAAGFIAFPMNRPDARTHWEQATRMFRELGETPLVAYGLAVTSATYIGDHGHLDLAKQTNDEALELGRGVGSPALVAQVLNIRGELTRVGGRDEEARDAYEEGLQISCDLGDEAHRCRRRGAARARRPAPPGRRARARPGGGRDPGRAGRRQVRGGAFRGSPDDAGRGPRPRPRSVPHLARPVHEPVH